MGRRARLASIVALLITSGFARGARADDAPRPTTLEVFGARGSSWDDIVRDAQNQLDTQGAVYGVGVRSPGATYGCSDYSLTFSDRFELHPRAEDVHAAPDGGGWIARRESRMSLPFRRLGCTTSPRLFAGFS